MAGVVDAVVSGDGASMEVGDWHANTEERGARSASNEVCVSSSFALAPPPSVALPSLTREKPLRRQILSPSPPLLLLLLLSSCEELLLLLLFGEGEASALIFRASSEFSSRLLLASWPLLLLLLELCPLASLDCNDAMMAEVDVDDNPYICKSLIVAQRHSPFVPFRSGYPTKRVF